MTQMCDGGVSIPPGPHLDARLGRADTKIYSAWFLKTWFQDLDWGLPWSPEGPDSVACCAHGIALVEEKRMEVEVRRILKHVWVWDVDPSSRISRVKKVDMGVSQCVIFRYLSFPQETQVWYNYN
jgi:hypothetical protein